MVLTVFLLTGARLHVEPISLKSVRLDKLLLKKLLAKLKLSRSMLNLADKRQNGNPALFVSKSIPDIFFHVISFSELTVCVPKTSP